MKTSATNGLRLRIRRGEVLDANCPSRRILNDITSKWGVLVLVALQDGTIRFSALRRKVGGVTEKMLTQTLQTLEKDGLVKRISLPVIPPHVEYSLTPLGEDASKQVSKLTSWIEENLSRILKSQI